MKSAIWLRRNVLSVVLITSVLFMTMLIVEQSRTIENQKSVIRLLYADSLELSAVKLRHAHVPKK